MKKKLKNDEADGRKRNAGAIYALGNWYYHEDLGLLPDREKARELLTRSADLLLGQHL